jgi:hypothetical protein
MREGIRTNGCMQELSYNAMNARSSSRDDIPILTAPTGAAATSSRSEVRGVAGAGDYPLPVDPGVNGAVRR